MRTINCRFIYFTFAFFLMFFLFLNISFISANTYISDVYFNVPDTVYTTNERIELKGYVYQTNYSSSGSLIANSSALANAIVNLTILNTTLGSVSNYTFTTDANGTFYSGSNYYASAINVTAPSASGYYYLRVEYKDLNNNISFSQVEINVINHTLDLLRVSSKKTNYNPSENVIVKVEALRLIGDQVLYISNISVNGSLRNSTKGYIQNFTCKTGANGKCSTSVTAPIAYGDYILEIENFKTFNVFSVSPFSYNLYMKDELGKSLKNVFALGEQAKVEVRINNASSSDSYTFSGYIANSAGVSVWAINSTILNSTNSFTNSFLFDVNARIFSYGTYSAYVTVTKTGDGSINSTTCFEVQDWILSVNKKSTGSGFEYEYNTFPNQTLKLEALPTYRSNGSVITNISSNSFVISLKDSLDNVISGTNATWNSSCGKSGCYEFSLTSPLNTGKYNLYTALSYSTNTQTAGNVINVINGVMSSQSTDKDGNVKELFGVNEYAYFSFSAYNSSSPLFNLSDAEVFIVSYMNGSEFSYTQLDNFTAVNSSNNVHEWAWNSSLQRIKMDFPKYGGVYNAYFFGNNRSLGANAKFIVNPYDVCSVPKNTLGTVSTGYYYVWQFKTSDAVYFEIKLVQANNPLGKASALNLTSGNGSSTYGMGSACNIDTTTKQVVSNATLSVLQVKNLESGAVQNINTSSSTCQASDTNGTYTCTVQPLTKWDGGQSLVKFNIQGQDGTTSEAYSTFEARAFYLYGWSNNWQNSPSDDIILNVRLYEAGSNWWGSYGSNSGIAGTITVKKVEYQGRDGEWFWPPVDSGYNVSNVSSASITAGTGTINLSASKNSGNVWKTGNYRVTLQATTTSGDTDYGYAWFGIKMWDVYGTPIECLSNGCVYKNYFNSKENITLYVKISKAGAYSYNYAGGENIWGNTTVGIKKIQDCRKWPCRDLNSSDYTASTIRVNASSPWYWSTGANISSSNKYLIQINSTTGTWGTGYYSVVLDVNGSDTGYAWFNTIAFYVDSQPTNSSGSGYKYNIRGNQQMYFNVTTTKSYKWTYSGDRYNYTDYVNVSLDSAVLRMWDSENNKQREFSYPADINITPLNISGNALVNVTYRNGTWPNGYYYGELTLKNSAGETSTGWLWSNIQPFRINSYSNDYEVDSEQCVNATLVIYDSDWAVWTPFYGNYSVTSVYENIWSNNGYSKTIYNNYTNSTFNASLNLSVCPDNGQWGSGSWGGYHYLNLVVKDNINNDSQTGWLSFRTVPFRISWIGGGGNKLTNANVEVIANLTKASSPGTNASGNLTRLYQWRYDNYRSTLEEYVFKIGNCYSNVSGSCMVNGSQNVTIYPPSGGWKIGYNYIQSDWIKNDNANVVVQDWTGIYFEGRAAYNGGYDNTDANGNWKYYFTVDENITIRLYVRDSDNNAANAVTISNVEYAFSGNDCSSEYCRSYASATWSIVGGGSVTDANGKAVLNIKVPSTNWTRGYYAIRATVQGASITGGNVRVKDMVAPNITISLPVNNATYNDSLSFSATTTKKSKCGVTILNYNGFYNWFCGSWNSTNSSNSSQFQFAESCNLSLYNYNGSIYHYEYIADNYHYLNDGINHTSVCSSSLWCEGPVTSYTKIYLSTGGLIHSMTLDILNYTSSQHYGLYISCYDDDYNSASALRAFKINHTGT
jgi:hypothetical protein